MTIGWETTDGGARHYIQTYKMEGKRGRRREREDEEGQEKIDE